MDREACVTQGQGPEITVSWLGRARFTVPRGQRHAMAKPVLAGARFSLPGLRGIRSISLPRLRGGSGQGRADVVYGVRGFAGQIAYSYWFVLATASSPPPPTCSSIATSRTWRPASRRCAQN